MKKDIEPKLKLISNYLKTDGEVFVIPEYQRPYSWDEERCDKLWQDVQSFISSGSTSGVGKSNKEPYFFGTIIADCSTDNKINLIDGQQRTTTFILLLKALLVRIHEILSEIKSDTDNIRLINGLEDKKNTILDILYKTDGDNRFEISQNWDFVKGRSIIENKSINEQYKNELQVILEAKDYVTAERNCYKIPRKQRDNKYTNFFRNFKFFYKKLEGCHESTVNVFAKTFLTECNIIEIRSWDTEQAITMFNSLNSTGMPLTDADIISAKMYSHARLDKEKYMEEWKAITETANKLSGKKIISIDSVLQQYMYIRRAEGKVYIKEGTQPDVTTPGVRRYYESEKGLLNNPLDLCRNLKKIVQIWDAVQDVPVVKLLLKFNENAKLFLISYLNRYEVEDIKENYDISVVECLIKLFAILELVDAGYSNTRFKTFLFGENVKLVDKNIPTSEITEDFKRHINDGKWTKDDIKKRINEYDKNILVYLNEYLYAKENGLKFNLRDNVNVEHIMPASGHNIESIRRDAGITSNEEFSGLVNLLGNKILLEEDINKYVSNDWFKTKKQNSVKDKKGYKDSEYCIAHDLVNFPRDLWTINDITETTQKVAERISNFIFS